MAAFTTGGAGNWSSTTTNAPWAALGGSGTGGVPGSGDTVTITKAVTVDTSQAAGTSGATGVAAVTVSTGGTLTIATGATLTLSGDLILGVAGNPLFTMAAGSGLAWATPSGSQYVWSHINNAYSVINGTSGSHCTVSSSGLGSPPYMVGISGTYGITTSTYCDWSNIGDSSPSHKCALLNDSVKTFLASYNTFTGCGIFAIPWPGATQIVQYLYNSHTSTVGTKCLLNSGVNALTTGTRQIIGCDFDQTTAIYPLGWTIQYCTFRFQTAFVAYGPTAIFDSNFFWQQNGAIAFSNPGPLVSNSYTLTTNSSANTHNWNTSGTSNDCTFDSFIWDSSYCTSGDATSMFCIVGAPTTVQNVIFSRGIVLPGYNQKNPGTIVSIQTGTPKNNRLTMEHCTSALNGTTNGSRMCFFDENLTAGVTPTAVTATLSAVVSINKSAHGLTTGNTVYCSGFTNVSEINNLEWTITVVDSSNFTLNGSSGLGETWNSAGTYNKNNLPPGTIVSFKANLGYCLGGSPGGYWLDDATTYGALNLGNPSNLDYNSLYNGINATPDAYWSSSGQGYSYNAGSVPGTHDLDYTAGTHGNTAGQNPQFVDTTRSFASWGVIQLGGTPTATQILNWMFTNNLSIQIPALLAWVRAGFVVQNAAYQAASYSGDASTVDANGNAWPGGAPGIGAMAYASVTTTGAAALLAM